MVNGRWVRFRDPAQICWQVVKKFIFGEYKESISFFLSTSLNCNRRVVFPFDILKYIYKSISINDLQF